MSDTLLNLITKKYRLSDIYELRLRKNRNIVLQVLGDYIDSGIFCRPEYVEEIILRATKYSLYTVNEQIKAGYISASGGIRIGICGEVVRDFDGIRTVKNISSLTIRLPHEIKGCADEVVKKCFNGSLHSTLIISKPGAGKTTLIRDLGRSLSDKSRLNVLILDERGEIAGELGGAFQFDVGSCDVMINADKDFGFTACVRAMRPDIIICDELKGAKDTESVFEALSCGVCVVATVHAGSVDELLMKPNFKDLISYKAFTRYVILSDRPKVGTIAEILDDNRLQV